MDVVESGAARLAVFDEGGSGPALVALHAGVADSRIWEVAREAWVSDGWRVVAYDRRGFGQSTWEPEDHSPVDDLFAVMDARGIESAVLVGNSMGGRLAIDAALQDPGRVRGLVLVGAGISGAPWPFGAPADPGEEALDQAIGKADEAGDVDEVNRLEAHFWLDGPLQPEGRVGGSARELFLDMNGGALQAPPVGETRWGSDSWDRAGEIDVPVLVVLGGFDETLGNEWNRDFATRLPQAELVELPGSAHLPMLDDPEAFLAVTRPFLATLM